MLQQTESRRAPAAVVAVALLGFLIALAGTYWDDAWHTEEGRDTFLIAPHIALYAGISLAGAAFTVWLIVVTRAGGLAGIRAHRPLLLALIGMVVALGAAPLDNLWHVAFGRDAVIWSPPHMLGIAGNLAIASGLLLELADRPAGWERGAVLVAGSALLAVAVVPVIEYETDVPQFDLVFYLPLLAAGSGFAFGLIRRILGGDWVATQVAVVYTAIVAAISIGLEIAGMPGPLIPLLVVPALVFDLARRRGAGLAVTAAVYVAAVFIAYVPYLNYVRSDLFLDVPAVVVGVPIALGGAIVALGLGALTPSGHRLGIRFLTPLILIVPLIIAVPAVAHDPGQGEELTTARVQAASEGTFATIEALPREHCSDLEPARVVARRAGEMLTAPAEPTQECELSGRIALPERGRWFVYGEFEHGSERVETWLPIHSGRKETRRDAARSLYVPPDVESSAIKVVAGIAMYAIFFAVVVAVPLLYPRQPRAWATRT